MLKSRKLINWIKSKPILGAILVFLASLLIFRAISLNDDWAFIPWSAWDWFFMAIFSLFLAVVFLVEYYWKQITKPVRMLVIRGAIVGMFNASLGYIAFLGILFFPQIVSTLKGVQDESLFAGIMLISLLYGTLPILIPAAFGGGLLVFLQHSDQIAGKLSTRTFHLLGLLLGVSAGIVISIFYWSLIGGRGSPVVFLTHTAEVTVIAALAGGFTARWLLNHSART